MQPRADGDGTISPACSTRDAGQASPWSVDSLGFRILDRELKGPLVTPFGIGVVAVLVMNGALGAVTGALAQFVKKWRSPTYSKSW
jgi:hypothetical protein